MISPIALVAVKRIDALFDIEREVNGLAADDRLERRRQDSQPLVAELEAWMRAERARLSRSSPVKPTDNTFIEPFNGEFRSETAQTAVAWP